MVPEARIVADHVRENDPENVIGRHTERRAEVGGIGRDLVRGSTVKGVVNVIVTTMSATEKRNATEIGNESVSIAAAVIETTVDLVA